MIGGVLLVVVFASGYGALAAVALRHNRRFDAARKGNQ